MPSPNSINFVLDALDCHITLDACGSLFKYDVLPQIIADATAVIYIDINQIKQAFMFQTDASDVVNSASSDIKYMVDMDYFPWDLNPANACLLDPYGRNAVSYSSSQGTPYTVNKMFVCHDFLRYLAKSLFGTPYAVDLFYNELQVLKNIRFMCSNAQAGCVWYDLYHRIKNISRIGQDSRLEGNNGDLYLTNATPDDINICRAIFQTIITQFPERFSNIEDTDLFQNMPFVEYDSLNFKLILHPSDGQHNLTKVDNIYARSYEIKLILVNTPVNPTVDPLELI